MSALPRLIGFEPHESLVLVGLTPGRGGRHEVGLTLRADLSDVRLAVDAQPTLTPTGDTHPCHPVLLAGALARNDCVGALVVVVSDTSAPPPSHPDLDDAGSFAVESTRAALDRAGITVTDELLVRERRWWSYRCDRPTCCPPEGTVVTAAGSDLLAAELAWNGETSTVLSGREAVVAQVAETPGAEATAVAEAVTAALPSDADATLGPASAEDVLVLVADLLDRFRTPEPQVAPDRWAALLLGLADVQVRDACLLPCKGEVGAAALRLWCTATRLAPPGHVAAPATLAALVAHSRGEGALAGAAAARALTDDPAYRLAGFAARALGGGIPPAVVRRTFVESAAVLRARGAPTLDGAGRVVPGRSRV